jgi:hypothetical protein
MFQDDYWAGCGACRAYLLLLFPMESQRLRFGFVPFAEIWNGQLVVLGFVIGLAPEWLRGVGISARADFASDPVRSVLAVAGSSIGET